ncbi:hypothetical protein [Streptomyces sp. DH41]|uniref:hypothetical protein n=1 Tax=Streptomyces sp. DH41 TaxID=3040125 RepID=UPI0024435008|nr:hypothetical protein [Streptomyces sp. DH41]MDG9726691.1 hypothetical protein [Streptomyces sp. DH41]
MSSPVDAEQAWRDLQRIRVPQERVFDEFERSGVNGPGATYTTAAIMWVFLAALGLDLPRWGVWLALAAYVTLLSALAVRYNRRSRMRLHHSHADWRMLASFVAGMVVTGTTIVLSGHLLESLDPMSASLIQATVSAAVYIACVGTTTRWSTGALRGRGARTAREEANR